MKQRSPKRQLKKITLRVKYLQEELSDCQEELEIGQHEMLNALSLLHKTQNRDIDESSCQNKRNDVSTFFADSKKTASLSDDLTDGGAELDIAEASQAPAWAKKLYRKIVLETHPDRLAHLDVDSPDRAVRENIYLKATQALRDDRCYDLLDIALDLDISIDDLPLDLQIKMHQQKENELLNKINDIKKQTGWAWYHADKKIHLQILQALCRQNNWPVPDVVPEENNHRPTRKVGTRPVSIREMRSKHE